MAVDVATTRRLLGPAGVFLPIAGSDPADVQRGAARRLEAAGWPVAWTNEVIGKDALVDLGVVLAATTRIAVGTSIANVWARPAQTLHGAASALAGAYPGRLVVGIGVGYPQQAEAVGREFGRPLPTVREYAAALADRAYPLLVAANGPQMLALAGEVSDGALPAPASPDATADARAAVGPDRLLVAYVDAGSGTPAQVTATVRAHLGAGADHVIAGVAYGTTLADGMAQADRLAPSLLAIR